VVIGDPQAICESPAEWDLTRSRMESVDLSELAKLSGLDPRRLREYRQGDRRPKRDRFARIVEALTRILDAQLTRNGN
jgi:transcriptional regulator with XRE-family HTH domain